MQKQIFAITAVTKTRISKKTSLTPNVNLNNYFFESTPTESTVGRTMVYSVACLKNHALTLICIKKLNENLLLLK